MKKFRLDILDGYVTDKNAITIKRFYVESYNKKSVEELAKAYCYSEMYRYSQRGKDEVRDYDVQEVWGI